MYATGAYFQDRHRDLRLLVHGPCAPRRIWPPRDGVDHGRWLIRTSAIGLRGGPCEDFARTPRNASELRHRASPSPPLGAERAGVRWGIPSNGRRHRPPHLPTPMAWA